MRKLKSAFSLTEILIALAIISVIATMFISIGKQGIESAYNMYYYNAFKGLSDATSYAYSNLSYSAVGNKTKFVNKIAEAFSIPNNNGNATISIHNGVKYTIGNNLYAPPDARVYVITMEIPSYRARVSNNSYDTVKVTTNFVYDEANCILVPREIIRGNGTFDNLSTRKDLLPYYIDDGMVGRALAEVDFEANTVGEIKTTDPKKYYSFKDAYCKLDPSSRFTFVANNMQCVGGSLGGILRLVDPKKIF